MWKISSTRNTYRRPMILYVLAGEEIKSKHRTYSFRVKEHRWATPREKDKYFLVIGNSLTDSFRVFKDILFFDNNTYLTKALISDIDIEIDTVLLKTNTGVLLAKWSLKFIKFKANVNFGFQIVEVV